MASEYTIVTSSDTPSHCPTPGYHPDLQLHKGSLNPAGPFEPYTSPDPVVIHVLEGEVVRLRAHIRGLEQERARWLVELQAENW
jgi:hypothetical protein